VWGPAYSDIAVAYAQRPSEFTPSDLAVLRTVAPLSYWRSTANCYNSDSTVRYSDPNFNIGAARTNAGQLAQLWVRLVKRMPDEIAATRLCRGSIAWNPFPGPTNGRTVKVPIAGVSSYFDFPVSRLDASPDKGAIRLAPLSPAAHQVGVWLRKLSDTRAFEWFAWRGATAYGIVLDPHGKIVWGSADIGGDPIVAVLTNQVSDAHLAGLREDGVSYIFAGARELDLNLALEVLNRELGIKRLEVNGGGVMNGAFLRAGLINEISLAIFPAVDGTKGSSSSFDSDEDEIGAAVPLRSMTLASSEVLECGAVWLRYQVRNA